MNREIKFRAWHKGLNQMLPNIQNHIGNNGFAFGQLLNNPDNVSIMQYTGLKDKNKIEIYEGDLLNIGAIEFGFITNEQGESVKYEVKFEGCDYILYRTDLKMKWGRLSRLEELGWICQVVGNVYESVSA